MSCVIDYGQQPPVLKCTICCGTDPFSLPMTVSQMSAIVKVFEIKHAPCAINARNNNAPKWAFAVRRDP